MIANLSPSRAAFQVLVPFNTSSETPNHTAQLKHHQTSPPPPPIRKPQHPPLRLQYPPHHLPPQILHHRKHRHNRRLLNIHRPGIIITRRSTLLQIRHLQPHHEILPARMSEVSNSVAVGSAVESVAVEKAGVGDEVEVVDAEVEGVLGVAGKDGQLRSARCRLYNALDLDALPARQSTRAKEPGFLIRGCVATPERTTWLQRPR